jgi:hypothetical protein
MSEAHKRTAVPHDALAEERSGAALGATTPAYIPPRGWRRVLRRCAWRAFEDRLLGEAAAVAFDALLPALPLGPPRRAASAGGHPNDRRSSSTTLPSPRTSRMVASLGLAFADKPSAQSAAAL